MCPFSYSDKYKTWKVRCELEFMDSWKFSDRQSGESRSGPNPWPVPFLSLPFSALQHKGHHQKHVWMPRLCQHSHPDPAKSPLLAKAQPSGAHPAILAPPERRPMQALES